MKKIMFNDKYGLTEAVLEGRKTQTRRIAKVSPDKDFIDFGIDNNGRVYASFSDGDVYPTYHIGEDVAIAQSYKDVEMYLPDEPYQLKTFIRDGVENFRYSNEKGYNNKLFVWADIMPYRIRITNIRAERLQDISEDDCLKEGIEYAYGGYYVNYNKRTGSRTWLGNDARNAFASLIDKTCGKGTWERNQWVFVYDFKLIDIKR